MKLRSILAILKKDLILGPKNPFFLIAIIIPLVFTFLINLVFGGLFSQQPVVGVYDAGDSQITTSLQQSDSFILRQVGSAQAIEKKVEAHNLDAGISLTADFDQQVQAGKNPEVTVYFSGESLAKDRLMVVASLTQYLRDMSNQEAPLHLEQVTLGEGQSFPLSDRFLPLIIITTVYVAGTFLTALTLLQEKEKNTLQAMIVTPANLKEVLVAKGILGFLVGLVTGLMAMFFNGALEGNFWLILLFLSLGLVMAVEIGIMLGIKSKDNPSLMTNIKSIQLLIFAPVIIYFFPQIPEWVGKIFPTYYFIDPLFDLSIAQGSWADNQLSFFILIGILIVLIFPTLALAKKLTK